MAKQMVTAGLKWPPETGAQVMMANAMPMAKAQPIWKMEPKTGTPSSFPAAEVVARVKDATEAMPGKLKVDVSLCIGMDYHSRLHNVEACCGWIVTYT